MTSAGSQGGRRRPAAAAAAPPGRAPSMVPLQSSTAGRLPAATSCAQCMAISVIYPMDQGWESQTNAMTRQCKCRPAGGAKDGLALELSAELCSNWFNPSSHLHSCTTVDRSPPEHATTYRLFSTLEKTGFPMENSGFHGNRVPVFPGVCPTGRKTWRWAGKAAATRESDAGNKAAWHGPPRPPRRLQQQHYTPLGVQGRTNMTLMN